MAEIVLRTPITLLIDIIEWDTNSLGTRIDIAANTDSYSACHLKLEGIWFYYTTWDQFTSLLLSGQQAVLTNINEVITLIINPLEKGAELEVRYPENYLEDYWVSFALKCKLDGDSLAILKKQFREVPKWW